MPPSCSDKKNMTISLTETLPATRILGLCPAAVLGSGDITALYTGTFGAVKANQKIFVAAKQVIDGHESIPATFVAVVPGAA
jgi:hypothetical protein